MAEKIIAFTRGVPPVESFPGEALISCAEKVIHENGGQILQYGNGAGYHPMCDFISHKHAIQSKRVLVGQGSLQLLDHLCRVALKKGESVFLEQPTYDRTITLFKRAQGNLRGFPITDGQIDFQSVKDALDDQDIPVFFYVIPDFQNPGGSTMSLENRITLVDYARKYGFWIVEDSPYRHLRYSGRQLPSLFELAPERVIHMSSFSKMISPGLRTGYMILPDEIAGQVIQFATDTYISPSMLDQAVVLAFLKMGMLDDHIVSLKQLFLPRKNALLSALDQDLSEYGTWTKPQGGYYVGFTLNTDQKPLDISSAAEFGLALSDGHGFFLQGGDRFLRLPFCALTEQQTRVGIQRLRTMICS